MWIQVIVEMILSDRDIKNCVDVGELHIAPFELSQLQPSSYDVTLSKHLWIPAILPTVLDITNLPSPNQLGYYLEIHEYRGFTLKSGEFILGSINEFIELPDCIAARLEGKSSLGRLGLLIHSTAGYVDPGFRGHLTLELRNISRSAIRLHDGAIIAQITFHRMSSTVNHPYGSPGLNSHYQDQDILPKPPTSVKKVTNNVRAVG